MEMNKEEFKKSFSKLKFVKNKVEISYIQSLVCNGKPEKVELSPISTVPPSQPFKEMLNSFRQPVVDILFIKEMREKQFHRITVNGFQIKGEEDEMKVKIHAMLEDNAGYVSSINTAWIFLDGEVRYGCENNLKESIEEGFERAYAYLFEDEKESYDIPFEEATKEKEDDPEEDD